MLHSSMLEALTKQRHRRWSEVRGAAGYVSCNIVTCVHFAASKVKNPLDFMHFTLHWRKPECARRLGKANDSIADGMLLVNEVGMAPRIEIATTGSKQHERTGAHVLQLCFNHYLHHCFVWSMSLFWAGWDIFWCFLGPIHRLSITQGLSPHKYINVNRHR